MSAILNTSPNKSQKELSIDDLDTLRQLLLGPEYKDLLAHKSTLENPELLAKHISPVIIQALNLRTESDNSVREFFTPLVENCLLESVTLDPKPVTEALYPVIGPAIRKSISVNMSQMTNSMEDLLDNSLSPKSFLWRFDAWRTGKSYAEVVMMNKFVYQVEQIFLIHKGTGLLLQHSVSETAITKDPDVVSSMLSAIQDFLRDSFVTEPYSDLERIKLGDLTVIIEHSPEAIIAAVVRGTAPVGLRAQLSETIEKIHKNENKRIKNYNGDASQFEHLQDDLIACLTNQARGAEKADKAEGEAETGSSKKKAVFLSIGLCVLAGIGYLTYSNHNKAQQWDQLQQALRAEPGIILSHSSNENGTYQLHGLVDSMAKSPASLVSEHTQNEFSVESNFRPYLSLESTFVLQRIEKALQPPTTTKLALNNDVLHLSGKADAEWLKQFKISAPQFAGVNTINLDKLETTSGNQ